MISVLCLGSFRPGKPCQWVFKGDADNTVAFR
jgi:hypothetical protein